MNRRQIFSTGAKLLAGLAGILVTRQLPVDKLVPIDMKRHESLEEIHFYVYPGRDGFRQAVVRSIADDIKHNGPTREIISRIAGG